MKPLFILSVAFLGLFLFLKEKGPPTISEEKKNKFEKPKKNTLRNVASTGAVSPSQPQAMAPINRRTDQWEKNLEKTLSVHGGTDLKDINIQKISSFIWKQHNLLLNVESVLIKIANQKGEQTSFKAIVDAQTGKILQTWDQPVFDHVNPRENFGIKLDPRHFE